MPCPSIEVQNKIVTILDKFEKVYKDAKESGNPESRVGYKYYVNNEIVSLLIYEAFNISDITDYYTYNINIYQIFAFMNQRNIFRIFHRIIEFILVNMISQCKKRH